MLGPLYMVCPPMLNITGRKYNFMATDLHARAQFFAFLRIFKAAFQHILDFSFAISGLS